MINVCFVGLKPIKAAEYIFSAGLKAAAIHKLHPDFALPPDSSGGQKETHIQ